MYSESEPFNQHNCFPCFDQPDLKGEITFMAVTPKTWIVRANAPALCDPVDIAKDSEWSKIMENFEIHDEREFLSDFEKVQVQADYKVSDIIKMLSLVQNFANTYD